MSSDDDAWVRQWSSYHMSIVAKPTPSGRVSLAIMPRTWRPEIRDKRPVAVVGLSRTDLLELLAMTKEPRDANQT